MGVAAKPMYQQLKDLIIGRISKGELRPRDRVPSENELVEAMNVSRMTANRALRELTDEGYVNRIAGRGTFVAEFRAGSNVLEVQNIADEIRGRGHTHTCEVLRQSRQRARGEVAKALHVEQGKDVFHLLLVHYESGTPIQLEDRHVLADFAPDCLQQDFCRVTPSAYLTGISPLQEAEQVVRAVQANAAVRQHLSMATDEPSLVIIRRTWAHGRPVTFARLHHPGSRYELTGHYTPPGTTKSTTDKVVELEKLKR
ncbi:MAG: histidine utilization repressor [Gammaproteobacteria bacterium]|nr:histidine utilization repressor [Gammaproteobacteria bacterium]MDH3430702.1 histidine utilization repressor [Gammaproteobacteria bacterium]MDH3433138.1 histidine utilization repressor [Gammaproteobacteria bacterium]